MKILKGLLVVLGVAALAVGGWYLFSTWVDVRAMMAVANANRSAEFPSPINQVYLSVAGGALGGLLLGIGLGLPRRTASGIRKEALRASAAAREAEIRGRAADEHPTQGV